MHSLISKATKKKRETKIIANRVEASTENKLLSLNHQFKIHPSGNCFRYYQGADLCLFILFLCGTLRVVSNFGER